MHNKEVALSKRSRDEIFTGGTVAVHKQTPLNKPRNASCLISVFAGLDIF